jgi:hypothetical protein
MTLNNDPRIDRARDLLLILAGNDEAWLDRVIAADKDKHGEISLKRVATTLSESEIFTHSPLSSYWELADKDAEIARLRMAERMNVETIAALNKRIEWLENICHAAYQLAGVVGAPVRFMDALGLHDDADIEELLPVTIQECSEFKDAIWV